MSSADEPYFSWTARQVVMTRDLVPATGVRVREGCVRGTPPRIVLDCRLTVGRRAARLVSFGSDDSEYTALIVGDVCGRKAIPIRAIDEEEGLLIAGTRCRCNAEILVAIPSDASGERMGPRPHRVLEHQLCSGGPIRDLVRSTGAVSVLVDWDATPTSAA